MTHNVPNRNWSYPTAIKFGVGRIAELAEHCKASGIQRPLLVTDKALAALPITAEARGILKAAGLGDAVFSEVDPNPNEQNMTDGIAMYLAGGHDGVVGRHAAASQARGADRGRGLGPSPDGHAPTHTRFDAGLAIGDARSDRAAPAWHEPPALGVGSHRLVSGVVDGAQPPAP